MDLKAEFLVAYGCTPAQHKKNIARLWALVPETAGENIYILVEKRMKALEVEVEYLSEKVDAYINQLDKCKCGLGPIFFNKQVKELYERTKPE